MAKKVFNNIAGIRVLFDGKEVEDVTSITLPDIRNTTTSIDAAGMVAAVDMPDSTHYEAMEASVAHNNGTNCALMQTPGKHTLEIRIARQVYDVAKADIAHQADRFRLSVVHKSSQKGSVERNNPLGGTEGFSVLRYEEIQGKKTILLIDAAAGKVTANGKNFSDVIQKLLQ